MKALIILFSVILSLLSVHCSDEELSSEEQTTNGQTAKPNQFPYQTLLILENFDLSYLCGGTLISEEWILTTAHCLQEVRKINVTLGTIYLDGRDGTTVTTSTYFITELNNVWYPDIGLIKLESPVELSDSIKPARLPISSGEEQSYAGSYAIASGWGSNSKYPPDPHSILHYTNVSILSSEECEKIFLNILPETFMCVRTVTENASMCDVDFGGPLVLSDTDTVVGIASILSSSCSSGYPAIFIRVTSYLDWIIGVSGIST